MWQCSQQHENREEAKFCSKCGEKRETRVYCPGCGTLLEPEDLFCTSCGHRRDAEPAPVPKPEVVLTAPVVPASVVQPVQSAPLSASAQDPSPAEPVTFSFGGTKIPMGDNPKMPEPAVRTVPASAPTSSSGGMNSTQSAILGFVLSAAVLGLAFYLITR